MNRRTKEIEDAIEYLTLYNDSFSIKAWQAVLKYIEQLEKSEQELLSIQERMSDDGK